MITITISRASVVLEMAGTVRMLFKMRRVLDAKLLTVVGKLLAHNMGQGTALGLHGTQGPARTAALAVTDGQPNGQLRGSSELRSCDFHSVRLRSCRRP